MTPNKRQKISQSFIDRPALRDHLSVILRFIGDKHNLIFARTCKFVKKYIYTHYRFTDLIQFENTSHLSNVNHIDFRLSQTEGTQRGEIELIQASLIKNPNILSGLRLYPEVIKLNFKNVHTILNSTGVALEFKFTKNVKNLMLEINNKRNLHWYKFENLKILDLTVAHTDNYYYLGGSLLPKQLEQLTFAGNNKNDIITTQKEDLPMFDTDMFLKQHPKLTPCFSIINKTQGQNY